MRIPPLISLNGQPIAGGKYPLVCTALVGRTPEKILAELDVVLPKRPDVLEWRVDYFEQISATAAVLAMADAIKKRAFPIPLLFTRRSTIEGGASIAIDEAHVLALYEAMCHSGQIDLIDYEMANGPANVARVQKVAQAHAVGLVLSFHDFSKTPDLTTLLAKFRLAEQLGANVAKVAVMPNNLDDVLTLLQATRVASKILSIPLISMSMGPLGTVTRLIGSVFGSSMSFAVGAVASAPGQVPIEDLSSVLAITRQAMKS